MSMHRLSACAHARTYVRMLHSAEGNTMESHNIKRVGVEVERGSYDKQHDNANQFEPSWIQRLPNPLYNYLHPSKCCCGCWSLQTATYIILIGRLLHAISVVVVALLGKQLYEGHDKLASEAIEPPYFTGMDEVYEFQYRQTKYLRKIEVIRGCIIIASIVYLKRGLGAVGQHTITADAAKSLRRGVSISIGISIGWLCFQLLSFSTGYVLGYLSIRTVLVFGLSFALSAVVTLHFDGVVLSRCLALWNARRGPDKDAP
eukprot:gb/GECG01005187.1/.p1 GENE.gb/GECG01005187.1/~~gb/GECG01005187.1/.p1  ORF type:complete len:259 (+),score=1.32 gb/GECG01005187.1/:1-777(+)